MKVLFSKWSKMGVLCARSYLVVEKIQIFTLNIPNVLFIVGHDNLCDDFVLKMKLLVCAHRKRILKWNIIIFGPF